MKRQRVFVGPCEIAGYYGNLARGLRELGVNCDYITYVSHPFGYKGESPTPKILKLMRLFVSLQSRFSRLTIARMLFTALAEACRVVWAFYAIFKYDCFIFGFGNSLLRGNGDLRIIKLLRKKVIVNLGHGSEARPPYIDGSYLAHDGSLAISLSELCSITVSKSKRIELFEKYADIIIGAPFSSSQFLRRDFVNFFAVGLPLSSASDAVIFGNEADEGERERAIRILHSPSHPALKGTEVIKRSIQALIRKGHHIDLVLLHGRPHADVINAIQNCDFVVDQIYSDTPMAGFASEAAWYGKPAIVGGYEFDYLKTLMPEAAWPPSVACKPEAVEAAIEKLIVDRASRLELGRKAQDFVQKYWDAAVVAERFMRIIDDDVPADWWVSPSSIEYLYGVGYEENKLKSTIRKMVEGYGVGALNLKHNSRLQDSFLRFCEVDGECL